MLMILKYYSTSNLQEAEWTIEAEIRHIQELADFRSLKLTSTTSSVILSGSDNTVRAVKPSV